MHLAAFTTSRFGAFLAVAVAVAATPAAAHRGLHSAGPTHHQGRAGQRFASSGHVIQCVAFAKRDAGIDLSGNARDWWSNASGVYERGARPEEGSVLSFRENGRMPLGHVAVVSGITDSRTIVIDQSHWGSGGIRRDMVVKDVSESNDWTAVRVQLGQGMAFGSIYPTHGFIYVRPDHGVMVANDTHEPVPDLDPAPADLRRSTIRRVHPAIEVAEATEASRPLDLSLSGIASDAPSRSFR